PGDPDFAHAAFADSLDEGVPAGDDNAGATFSQPLSLGGEGRKRGIGRHVMARWFRGSLLKEAVSRLVSREQRFDRGAQHRLARPGLIEERAAFGGRFRERFVKERFFAHGCRSGFFTSGFASSFWKSSRPRSASKSGSLSSPCWPQPAWKASRRAATA